MSKQESGYSPVQLTSPYDLARWHIWNEKRGRDLRWHTDISELIATYQTELDTYGSVATGKHPSSNAVFVIKEGNTYISGGTVAEHDSYTKTGSLLTLKHAYIAEGYTDDDFRNEGLNTIITQARINWAIAQRLAYVLALVRITNAPAFIPKAKLGFIIDGAGRTFADVILPLNAEYRSMSGIPHDIPMHGGEILRLSQLIENAERFNGEYGVFAGRSQDSHTELLIRMIPRDFGGPREI